MASPKTFLLSKAEEDLIHDKSVECLREIGVRVDSESVLELLAERGASIDQENHIAKITERMINEALDMAEAGDFDGLVIGNQAEAFSAGANIFGIVMASQNEMWDQLEGVIKLLQDVNMRIRYFPKPVVVAV